MLKGETWYSVHEKGVSKSQSPSRCCFAGFGFFCSEENLCLILDRTKRKRSSSDAAQSRRTGWDVSLTPSETDLVRQIDDCGSTPIRFIAIFQWRLGGLFFANKGIVQPGENEAAYNPVEKSV